MSNTEPTPPPIRLVHEPRDEKLPRFSASQTLRYLECPAKWFWSREIPGSGSRAAALGSEVHARLERWQLGEPDAPDDQPVTAKRDAVAFLEPDDLRRAEVMARAVRPAFPGPDTNAIPEREFMVTLVVNGRRRCQLSGFIDTQHRTSETEAEVIDLKTTSSFARAHTPETLRGDPQSLIYAGVTAGEIPELERVVCRWVYAHSKNSRKILGPEPVAVYSRAEVALGLHALWLSAWEPMIKAGRRKTAPKGNAPEACTKYRWGCDYCASGGGPCTQFVKLSPVAHLTRDTQHAKNGKNEPEKTAIPQKGKPPA